MITHILVYNALEKFLQPLGYRITSWRWNLPLLATHPKFGEIEVYFYGENFRVDESESPVHKRTRSEAIQVWKTEKTMMSEEAGHVCVAKAVLLALTKLATRKGEKRIGLAFPENHNFMKHLHPLIRLLTSGGVECFFICSDLSVAHIPAQTPRNLLVGGEGELLGDGSQKSGIDTN